MADTIPCFGCSTPLANEPGNYYCPTCVAKQQAEQGNEREVFDAYMRWADQQGGIEDRPDFPVANSHRV